jgi:D-amino-acid dehydrogenase
MNDGKHVIVIGAGIAGISVAYYLSKKGIEVTVLDRDDGTDNCSYGNAGMIVPSHIIPLASPGIISKGLKWMLSAESPFYIRPRLNLDLLNWGWKFKQASTQKHVEQSAPILKDLLLRSRELLVELEDKEFMDFDFHKRGLFMFCRSEKGLEEEAEVVHKANELGMPAEVLTPEEVAEKEPALDLDIIGATYFPKDAHLHPGSLMDELKSVLAKRGVTFEYQTEVTGFENNGNSVTGVITSKGQRFRGSEVVVCTGAWTPAMAREIGVKLPMQAGKGYSITLEEPKVLPENCGIFAEEKVTMTPMKGMLRFAGTMEIIGTDRSINPKKISGLKKSVCRYAPEFTMDDLDVEDIWVGLRPISPDGLPYVGKLEKYDNLYTSTGQAMMGMSLSPASGEIVADLITNGKSELEHTLIDPNRYN